MHKDTCIAGLYTYNINPLPVYMYIMEKNKSPVVLAKRCGYYLCPNPERRAVHWFPGEGGEGGEGGVC